MHVIVSRSRITGALPHYQYRALVPLSDVRADRRMRCVILRAMLNNQRVPSTRFADVIAPDVWFERNLAVPSGLAAHLMLVTKRVEALIIRTAYPEMTAELPPLLFALDHDPGDATCRLTISDLNGAFDRLAPSLDTLMAADLGLFQRGHRDAA